MEIITVSEAAKRLGIKPRRVRQLIGEKRLPAEMQAGTWFIASTSLDLPAVRNRVGGWPKGVPRKKR